MTREELIKELRIKMDEYIERNNLSKNIPLLEISRHRFAAIRMCSETRKIVHKHGGANFRMHGHTLSLDYGSYELLVDLFKVRLLGETPDTSGYEEQ